MDRLQVLCFAGTYGLALACDLSRAFFRGKARWAVFVGLCVLGLVVHTAYLANRANELGRWQALTVFDSLLVVAWTLGAVNLYLVLRAPRQAAIGAFLLPVVLALTGLAAWAPRADWADWGGPVLFWGTVHGLFLLVGAASAGLAFATGLMYLVQDARLRGKRPVPLGFTLPSLEQSERINRWAITLAFPTLTFGVGIGLGLEWFAGSGPGPRLGWADPKVIFGTLTWATYAAIAHARFRWAMRGRRVITFSVWAFFLLAFTLVGVDLLLPTAHGVPSK